MLLGTTMGTTASEFHVEDPPRVLKALNVKIQKIHAMEMVCSFYSQPYYYY